MLYIIFFVLMLIVVLAPLFAWDNEDGTYTNPMIHADYPDSEIIRVKDDYFYLSSSFHFVPGDPIMHSKDLVHWKPAGFTIPDYHWDPRFNLDGNGERYGRGSWAPTLRYNKGMYYAACYAWSDDSSVGVFVVSRAKDISGPWEINLIHEKLYDPGLFFDDDGKVYVIHGQGNIYVTELDSDVRNVVASRQFIYSGEGAFEGSHVYKINGMYYILCPGSGVQHCLRSKNIYGPYEHKPICVSELNCPGTFLHQGGIIDTPKGEWWAVIFQDRGKHGRIPFLLPVKWEDGWPMIVPVMTYKKPDIDGNTDEFDDDWRSDNFDEPKLGLQWQWNHRPVNDKWSLSERPGFLRLYTARIVNALRHAQNTLTQQILGPDSGAIVKLDVCHLMDGDYAGLGLFCSDSTSIAVTLENGVRRLVLLEEPCTEGSHYHKNEIADVNIEQDDIWLKVEIPYLQYAVNYYYSLDGKSFTKLGDSLGIPYNFFADWLAPRYCIYNYATRQAGGYADFDSFEYILPKRRNNLYQFGDRIDTQFYDAVDPAGNCGFKWVEDGMKNIFIEDPGCSPMGGGNHGPLSWTAAAEGKRSGAWVKFNRVDFGEQAMTISARVKGNGKIAIHLNDTSGTELAAGIVSSDNFVTINMPLEQKLTGVHPLSVVFYPNDGETILLREFRLENN